MGSCSADHLASHSINIFARENCFHGFSVEETISAWKTGQILLPRPGAAEVSQSRWASRAPIIPTGPIGRILQRNRLSGVAAGLIEAAGPLSIIGAQAIYLSQPVIGLGNQWQALAEMLENQDELRHFATFLREENLP